ncbi:unnamed protein product [Oikopleura dioica]|uniref:Uncharacterized protein n=1 Tax=Oikopleura dioica TaxID=34765 RepID=E4XUS3_OIKDI|nr:unnamed protein product [Oikopleura dioica]
MGNCGGKPIAKETIDESQKSHQQIPKALIRSEVRKSVRHVDLSGNSIKEIDSKFWLNENIVEINISKNSTFCTIPAELAKLSKLERLDLSNTGITDIPAFVWTMQSLKILNISGTKVSSLGLLAENNIASLDISGLGLTELPASVNAFKNLQVLNASGNKLTTLPDEISKCEKLKELNLEENPLTHLPFAENLQKLEVLKITKDQKEKAVTLHESIYKEKNCLTCAYFKSGAAPVAPKRSESLAKKNEEAEMNVTIVTASTEVKAAPRIMEPPKIVIDEFEENTEIKEEKTNEAPEAAAKIASEEPTKIEKKDETEENKEDAEEEKRSRKSSSSSSSSSESGKSCSDCDQCDDEPKTEQPAEIEAEEKQKETAQESAIVIEEEKTPSEEQKITIEQLKSHSEKPTEAMEQEEPAEITFVIEKEEKSEIPPESPKPEIAPKPKSVSFSIEEYPGEVDHVVEKMEITESKEEGEEGVKITTLTTTVTTVINGDENSTCENVEKSEKISTSENVKQAQTAVTSESENFQSEIIRSRGVGSVKRSMMMFMAEQEKAAESKTSATRNVKKMPAYVDYQTDQPSITGAGVVRVAVPIPQNFVVSER